MRAEHWWVHTRVHGDGVVGTAGAEVAVESRGLAAFLPAPREEGSGEKSCLSPDTRVAQSLETEVPQNPTLGNPTAALQLWCGVPEGPAGKGGYCWDRPRRVGSPALVSSEAAPKKGDAVRHQHHRAPQAHTVDLHSSALSACCPDDGTGDGPGFCETVTLHQPQSEHRECGGDEGDGWADWKGATPRDNVAPLQALGRWALGFPRDSWAAFSGPLLSLCST